MAEKIGSPLLRAVIVCGEGLLTGCECDLLGPPFVVVGLLVVGCWLLARRSNGKPVLSSWPRPRQH